jgi:hypothetical protein
MRSSGRHHTLAIDATAPRRPTPTKLRVRTLDSVPKLLIESLSRLSTIDSGEEDEGTVSN